MTLHRVRRRPAGFTLMELMVVIAIMALLGSLTLMGFRHAQIAAMRNRSVAFLSSVKAGLENYKSEFGEYPRPKRPDQTTQFGKATYNIGGSLMLYQAMSGDGDDQIDIATSSQGASDGKISNNEVSRVMMKEMPVELRRKDPMGWLLVDGFGHPFQYDAPNPQSKVAHGVAVTKESGDTINTTYDLWSYGEDDEHTTQRGLEAKRSEQVTAKWVKNW